MTRIEDLLQPGDALFLVDVQIDFCPGGALPIEEGDKVVPVLNRWIAAAVAKDMAREMLPPPRTMGLVLIFAVLALVIGFWLGRRSTNS
jgi:hypothetical protein